MTLAHKLFTFIKNQPARTPDREEPKLPSLLGLRKGKANQESTSRRRRKTRYAFSVASRLSYPPDPLMRTLDPRRERQEKYKT